jgi:hypothetical protein
MVGWMALIGDRERERAAALLRRHYLQGRLSVEELSARLAVALRARHDGEVRLALSGLPHRPDQAAAVGSAVGRALRRGAFLVAVWTLWWAASLVVLAGFVASVLLQGLTLTNALVFPALWVGLTLAARHLTRRGRPARP